MDDVAFEYDRNCGFKVMCFCQGSGIQIKSEKDEEGCFCFSKRDENQGLEAESNMKRNGTRKMKEQCLLWDTW